MPTVKHLIEEERKAQREYEEKAEAAPTEKAAHLYRHIEREERGHEKELKTMTEDYYPVSDRTLADLNRANQDTWNRK